MRLCDHLRVIGGGGRVPLPPARARAHRLGWTVCQHLLPSATCHLGVTWPPSFQESTQLYSRRMRSGTLLERANGSAGLSLRLILCTTMFFDFMHSWTQRVITSNGFTLPGPFRVRNAFSGRCIKTQRKRPLLMWVEFGDNVAVAHKSSSHLALLRGLPLHLSLMQPASNAARNVCRATTVHHSSFVVSSGPIRICT